jgi:hypothetical protein
MATIILRRTDDDPSAPPPLFSGTYDVDSPGGWHLGEPIRVEQDDPLPLVVRALVPRVRVGG